jgi:hypothetical protein
MAQVENKGFTDHHLPPAGGLFGTAYTLPPVSRATARIDKAVCTCVGAGMKVTSQFVIGGNTVPPTAAITAFKYSIGFIHLPPVVG